MVFGFIVLFLNLKIKTLTTFLEIPFKTSVRNGNSFSVVFVLFVAKSVFTVFEALSINVTLVPRAIHPLIAPSVWSCDDGVALRRKSESVFRTLGVSPEGVNHRSDKNFLPRLWLDELEGLELVVVGHGGDGAGGQHARREQLDSHLIFPQRFGQIARFDWNLK